jgi:addiction module HigA family antidote
MRDLKPVHPGEMLEEEFLKPMGLTKYRLAKELGVPAPRIGEIVAGQRSVTAETDLLLCQFFGLGDGWWLSLQNRYDLAVTRERLSERLAQVHRYAPQTITA